MGLPLGWSDTTSSRRIRMASTSATSTYGMATLSGLSDKQIIADVGIKSNGLKDRAFIDISKITRSQINNEKCHLNK